MKLRSQFVSNSSSASFVIPLSAISAQQLQQIVDYEMVAKQLGMDYVDDAWKITVGEVYLSGDTWMDNFDFIEFLDLIGVSSEVIEYYV